MSPEQLKEYSKIFEEVIDQAWSKKIIDMMYSRGLDASLFSPLLIEIKDYFDDNKYWTVVKSLDDKTINEIIDDCAEDCGYIQNSEGKWIKNEIEQEYPTKPMMMNEKETTMWSFSDVSEFKEMKEGDKVEIQIMRTGKWQHPIYGEVVVTPEVIDGVVENFTTNQRWIDLAVDENHEPNHKALGWFRELSKKWNDILNASIELTKAGAELINQGAYKYFSPEIVFNKKDEETWKTIKNLLIGGAFTNRPFFKAMQPLMASEVEVANKLWDQNRDFLFFNTNSSMKTVLDLLGKFAEKQALSIEDKGLLQSSFSELSEDDKTKELTDAVEEATKEVVIEAPVVVETPIVVQASEVKWEEITLQASEYESLKNLASKATELIRKARESAIATKVASLSFSETNKTGIILPKTTKSVVDFALSLNETQSEEFLKIVSNLQVVFSEEIGHNGSVDEVVSKDVIQFFMEKLHMNEEEAIAAAKEAAKE